MNGRVGWAVRRAVIKASSGWGGTVLGGLAQALGVFTSSRCAPDGPAMPAPVTGDAVQFWLPGRRSFAVLLAVAGLWWVVQGLGILA